MPPAAKRRRVATNLTRQPAGLSKTYGIAAFGRISKAQIYDAGKDQLTKLDDVESRNCKGNQPEIVDWKLKLPSEIDSQVKNCATSQEPALPGYKDKSPALSRTYKIPRKRKPLDTSNATPTKGARSCLETLALASSSPAPSSSPVAHRHETPPSSPVPEQSSVSGPGKLVELPVELREVVDLHSSFLTALSLHYAHNGPTTPADLRILGPSVEKVWGRRRVTIEDVKRILALAQADHENTPSLYLSDYGHGKICLEVPDSAVINAQRQFLNEDQMKRRFTRSLQKQWNSYLLHHGPGPSVDMFIKNLSLLPIAPCASLSKLGPLLAKGQRRLEDLKAGAIRAQERPLGSGSANAYSSLPKSKDTKARSSDLLLRIQVKQLHQATLPPPPSADALAQKSALQRLPDIAPVLECLVISSQKHCNNDVDADTSGLQTRHVSFTMPTLVQHLQMSLRNPIAKDEAIKCIRLFAEVAPEWVGIREVGKLIGVTIRGCGIGREQLMERVQGAIEKL